MKKVIVGFVLLLVLAMSSVLVYAQQRNLSGEWVLSVQGMSLKLVMAQDGEKISGTLESPHGDIRLTGDVSNGKVTLSGASPEPHAVHLTGTATVGADGSMAGHMSVEQTEMTFTAVRAQAK